MPRRKQVSPGSVFTRMGTQKLCVKYRGKQYATGFNDTPQGRILASNYLELLHKEYMGTGLITIDRTTINLKDAWSDFEKDHLQHKHLKTQKSYRFSFIKICGNRNFTVTTDSLGRAVQEYYNSTQQVAAGRNVVLRSFRVFCNYCYEQKIIAAPVSFKRLIVQTHKPIRTYTDEELDLILNAYKNSSERYYLFLLFLRLTGARLTETLDIRKSDVRADRIEMSNKINKQTFETIPVTEQLSEILLRIEKYTGNSAYLFGWSRNNDSRIRTSFRNTCERLGIECHGIHSIRKTFASNLIERGVDLAHVKDLMRHKDVKTTLEHYNEYRISKLREILEQQPQKIAPKLHPFEAVTEGNNGKFPTVSSRIGK